MSVQIDGSTGNIIATKADYSGNVSIGGTLTYEDVTNIDSVGLITARNGIKVDDLGVQVGTGATVDSAAANTLTFLTGGSERVRIDSSGRFGLGTSSPSQKLHIQDSSGPLLTFDDATTQFGHIGSYNKLVGSGDVDTFLISSANSKPLVLRAPTGQTISFDIASSEALRITSGGKVKIANHGTNDLRTLSALGPQTQIQFGTAEDVGGFLLSTNNGQFGLSGGGYYNGSNWVAKHTASAQIRTDGDGAIVFFANTSLTSGNTFTPTERFRIDDSGNMGLNTSSNLLSNANRRTISINGNSSAAVALGVNGTREGHVYADASSMEISAVDNYMYFTAGSSERMRINTNGTVDIDVAGTYQGKQTSAHYINNNINNQWIYYMQHTGTNPYGITIRYKGTNVAPNNTSNTFIHCEDYNADRFSVRSNGDCDSATGSYGSYSDIKLKENIVDAPSQWLDLKNIKVRNFNFTEESGLNGGKFLGVIAQEVELVSAGLVSDVPDRDEDNNPTGTTTKSVKYSILYMKSIKALQEAMERIETLEAKVAALEG